MLRITVPAGEYFNEETSEFVSFDAVDLVLEHSLLSLSKWESKFHKPFLGQENKTNEEIRYYVEAMIITPDYPENILQRLGEVDYKEINEYIASPESATTFNNVNSGKGNSRPEIITSELIYYWLVSFKVDFEVQTWHLNRLFALLQIINIKNSKDKPMSRSEIAQRNRELNAKRRAKLGTSG